MSSDITTVKADNIVGNANRLVPPSGGSGGHEWVQEAGVTQPAQVAEAAPGTVQPPSRRDRLRAATIEEIIQTARQLLVKDGPEAVSLRAIAREMGMTAPGLYRYFGSYEELHRHLCAGIFTELGADIHRAIEAAEPPPDLAHAPEAKLTVKMVAACREFRRWALNHKDEFGLVFGVPLPGLNDGRYDIADECALAFAGTFFTLFLEMWHKVPFPVSVDYLSKRRKLITMLTSHTPFTNVKRYNHRQG